MRVTITQLSRATGTSPSSWRTWLAQPGCTLSIEYGGYRGGTRDKRGRVRYLDLDEATTWLNARGGAQLDESALPQTQLDALVAELHALARRMQHIEELLLSGGYRPPLASRVQPRGEQHRRLVSRPPTPPIPPDAADDPVDGDVVVDTQAPIQGKSTSSSSRPPFPDYLRSRNAVGDDHGIPDITVRKAIAAGKIPVVREQSGKGWKLPRGYVLEAFDDEGIERFHRTFAQRLNLRPGDRCETCDFVLD